MKKQFKNISVRFLATAGEVIATSVAMQVGTISGSGNGKVVGDAPVRAGHPAAIPSSPADHLD